MTIKSTPYGTCYVSPEHLRAGDVIGYGKGTVEVRSITQEDKGFHVVLQGPWRAIETTWKAKGRTVELYVRQEAVEAREAKEAAVSALVNTVVAPSLSGDRGGNVVLAHARNLALVTILGWFAFVGYAVLQTQHHQISACASVEIHQAAEEGVIMPPQQAEDRCRASVSGLFH